MAHRGIAVGPLETNCYVVWDENSRHGAIIDPGGDRGRRIADIVSEHGLDIKYVLLTHGHFDHSFYAGDFAKKYNVPVGMHEADVPLLTDGLGMAAMFYDLSQYVEFEPSLMLGDGDIVGLGDSEMRVLHTPGHSRGGLCFVTDTGVFCGDTIFAASIGRTDLPGGDYNQLIESIRSQILTIDDAVALHPGHGPSTTVGAERSHNPFLR